MKRVSFILKNLLLVILLISVNNTLIAQDYLESVTATGDGVTTNNSKAWTDVVSVTIDVTNISNLLVIASINMRPDGTNTNGREANYNIYRSDDVTDNSGVIKRQMRHNSETGVESWGIGTLVHIFDVSSLSGNVTYVIEHSNQGISDDGRNVYSSIRLSAIALTTEKNGKELSNSVKRLDADVTTISSSYSEVTGLVTDAITLPIQGSIYVMASINGKANSGNTVAEYQLQSSSDGGTTWSDLGLSVKRTMVNYWDDGIISLVGLLQNQSAGNNYKFRVIHKRVSGTATVTTHNCNLVAFALTHSDGNYAPFYSETETGSDITGVSSSPSDVTSTTITTVPDISGIGPRLFINSQYLVSASNLDVSLSPVQRMRAANKLYIDDGTTTTYSDEYYRYIPDNNNYGSGGFIGVTGNLSGNTAYTVGMKHSVNYVSNPDATEDETLTTSRVILLGFQTYEQAGVLPVKLTSFKAEKNNSSVKLEWTTASEINNECFIVQKSDNAVNFKDIIRVEGAKNSNVVNNYTAYDYSLINKITYYRLKQIDFDGHYSYSKIICVKNILSHKIIYTQTRIMEYLPFN